MPVDMEVDTGRGDDRCSRGRRVLRGRRPRWPAMQIATAPLVMVTVLTRYFGVLPRGLGHPGNDEKTLFDSVRTRCEGGNCPGSRRR